MYTYVYMYVCMYMYVCVYMYECSVFIYIITKHFRPAF